MDISFAAPWACLELRLRKSLEGQRICDALQPSVCENLHKTPHSARKLTHACSQLRGAPSASAPALMHGIQAASSRLSRHRASLMRRSLPSRFALRPAAQSFPASPRLTTSPRTSTTSPLSSASTSGTQRHPLPAARQHQRSIRRPAPGGRSAFLLSTDGPRLSGAGGRRTATSSPAARASRTSSPCRRPTSLGRSTWATPCSSLSRCERGEEKPKGGYSFCQQKQQMSFLPHSSPLGSPVAISRDAPETMPQPNTDIR